MQVERDSARQDQSHSSDEIASEILARLGGRFAADVASLLNIPPSSPPARPQRTTTQTLTNFDPNIHFYAVKCIKDGNIKGAIEFIERHVPDQRAWLDAQIQRLAPHYFRTKDQPTWNINIVPDEIDGVLIDPETGRIARALGQFKLFRAWAYALHADDGDGWIDRVELETIWKQHGISNGKRQTRRLLREGITLGYWSCDVATHRVYITGQVRLSRTLIKYAIEQNHTYLYETNKPGKRRVKVDLSGSLQRASAQLYSAWLVSKDRHDNGVMISRDMLCALWGVSVPTLLKWERKATISKQSNYAQSNETSIDNIPKHAYLTLNRDGTYSTSWRLPNTYRVKDTAIEQYSRTGKARRIRQVILVEIAISEQRSSTGDAALPGSDKRYFMQGRNTSLTAFKACDHYLRKLGRADGDLRLRRYFYLGKRHSVRLFEPFNLRTNAQETSSIQRDFWWEKDASFGFVRQEYRAMLRS